jgi:hypothetical protein
MASKKITLTELKMYLKSRSKEQLITSIAELYKKFPAVKEHYQLEINPASEAEIAEGYKKTIKDEFFPARGYGQARLSVARKAVNDFKKLCNSPEAWVDIMLFYVEQGVEFTTAYGDIDEPFYNSMESMFEKALELVQKHDLYDFTRIRSQQILRDTSGMGWGFHDMLSEIYAETFEEF